LQLYDEFYIFEISKQLNEVLELPAAYRNFFYAMKKIFLINLLLCFILIRVSAQSDYAAGYIVKNNGDTLKGRIFLSAANIYSSKCMFRPNEMASDEKYLPEDLKSFKLDDGLFFVSRDIVMEGQTRKVFLEWVVKGKINLFVYSNPGNSNRYYMEKADTGFYELRNTTSTVNVNGVAGVLDQKENREYISTLAILLGDCPQITREIYDSKLETKNLKKLSVDYHNIICKDKACLVFERKSKKVSITIGASISYNFSTLKNPMNSVFAYTQEAYDLIKTTHSNLFAGGLSLEISNFDFLSPRISITTDIAFINANYTHKVYGTIYSINMERFSESVKYCFSLNKLRPYISLGPVLLYRTKAQSYPIVISTHPTSPVTVDYGPLWMHTQFGLTCRVGVDYYLSNAMLLNLSGNFERCNRFIGYANDPSSLSTYYVQLGLAYRLQ